MLAQLAAWVGRGELQQTATSCPGHPQAIASAAATSHCALTAGELEVLRAATSTYSKPARVTCPPNEAGTTPTTPAPVQQQQQQQQRWQPDSEAKRKTASPALLTALETRGCFGLIERLRNSPANL
jgi:curli biogenesis system outer membrane secretion channel CsgG